MALRVTNRVTTVVASDGREWTPKDSSALVNCADAVVGDILNWLWEQEANRDGRADENPEADHHR